MVVKRLEDIEREKYEEKREKFKDQIVKDIEDVTTKVFNKKKKMSLMGWFAKIFLYLFLGVVIINLILGNVWLLRFFIKDLFLK